MTNLITAPPMVATTTVVTEPAAGDDSSEPRHLPDDAGSLPDLVLGADRRWRPRWAATDPLLRDYYDTEWGTVVTDERSLFELLALECFGAGLRWQAMAPRREALRRTLYGFDPDVLAGFDEPEIELLLGGDGIIRNRRKVAAVIANAAATVTLRGDGGLVELVWSHMPALTPVPRSQAEVPRQTAESEALAAALKGRGFRLVGPVTMQSLMAAAGVVDAHLIGSHRRGCTGLWTRTGRRRARPELG